jgi:hypothetical protein
MDTQVVRGYVGPRPSGLCQTVREMLVDSTTLGLLKAVSYLDVHLGYKRAQDEFLIPGWIPTLPPLRLILLLTSFHSEHHKWIRVPLCKTREREIAGLNN